MSLKTKIHRKYQFTPLRYPGGKTSLFQFFDEIIKLNEWTNTRYIEPYAGGAGAALSLLLLEKVDSVVINDLDRAIYAFWRSVLEDTERFVDKIEKISVTVDEWRKQKETYKKKNASTFDLGFATFFINRTNRSGVMNAGPIGGMNQDGNYKIDVRYNKDNLIAKIELLGLYKDRITVLNEDGANVIKKYAKSPNSFFYIDPPYFAKAAGLYMSSFKAEDHEKLASELNKRPDANWIVTYDNVPQIERLYGDRRIQPFSLRYSVRNYRVASELMIFSDSIQLS